jgi:hypothetical protein
MFKLKIINFFLFDSRLFEIADDFLDENSSSYVNIRNIINNNKVSGNNCNEELLKKYKKYLDDKSSKQNKK